MAAVKRLSLHHYSADYISWSFQVIEFIFSSLFENRIPPVLGGVASLHI